MSAPAAPRTTSVTSAADGRTHQVADDAYTAGLVAGDGCYTALCGRRVAAAALVCPPGQDCWDCAAAGAPDLRRPERGRHRASTRRGRHRGGAR